jgi:very-short-patch-repair endonuclease
METNSFTDLNVNKLVFNSKEILYIKDINNELWFKGVDIAKLLGYSKPRNAITQHIKKECKLSYSNLLKQASLCDLINLSYNDKKTVYINLDGFKILISVCRKNISDELLTFLETNFDINIPKYIRYECKEAETLKYLKEAFNNIEIIYQFKCGNYRIDMFMPLYKIAIECDENGHNNRDKIYEINREKYIIEQGFKLVRFNPDEPNFSIFKVINKILILIMDK